VTEDRRPSSTDVARLANVSQSAVSRTFTPGASVAPATRDRVLAAAEALGYRPNLLPRMLHTDRTNMIAVVAGGLLNPFYTVALDAIAKALGEAGKIVILVRVESDQTLDEVVAELAGYRVDAVVSALSVHSEAAARALDAMRIPVIQIAHGAVGERIWTVAVDNQAAGRKAADVLLQAGGTRFGYIGAQKSPNQDGRARGYCNALAAAGVTVDREDCPTIDYQGGAAATRALLDRAPIDALFCANDLIACGAMDAARGRGLSCPSDIRIIGFDNIEQAGWPTYALTTFDQQINVLATMVMRAVTDGAAADRHQLIEARLIERSSTASV
jgi:DNA-binding LacI/PurR family transcriptional regulator